MRESWTDDRLDDFRHEMSEFRQETKAEFIALRGEIRTLQQEMNLRFDSLQRSMLQLSGLMIAALVAFIVIKL